MDAAAKAAVARWTRPASIPWRDPQLDELMLEVVRASCPGRCAEGRALLARVKSMRKNLAQQLGFLVPRSYHGHLQLKERSMYLSSRCRNCPLGVTTGLAAGHQFRRQLAGSTRQDTREPAFDVPANGYSADQPGNCCGYAVVEQPPCSLPIWRGHQTERQLALVAA